MGQAVHAVEYYENFNAESKELWYYKDAWGLIWLEQEYFDIEKRTVEWISKIAKK